MSQPWLKFYPSDWRADPALRVCSIGARGLWMEMLCIMHEATPRGSLLVNGRAVTDRQLANLCGVPARDALVLVSELDEAGVFSRDADGTIYSRRIRRDEERALRDKANGGKGGNPKVKGVGGGVNPQPNPPVNTGVKAQTPESRVQKEGEDARAADPDPSESISISADLLKSCGLDADAPEGFGLHHQITAWRNASIPKDFIVATSLRIVKSYGSFPSLSYLIKAMQNEWRKACEQPTIRAEKSHAKSAENNSVAAVLRGLTGEFERSEGEAVSLCDDLGGFVPKGQLQ